VVGTYVLLYHPGVVKNDIPQLDPPTRARVKAAIESRLTAHPEQHAKPLAYTATGLWSLRVGDWRVIFALRGRELWILRIGHRRDVYRSLSQRRPPAES
jgi:mRNA interferase RelE/StbE